MITNPIWDEILANKLKNICVSELEGVIAQAVSSASEQEYSVEISKIDYCSVGAGKSGAEMLVTVSES